MALITVVYVIGAVPFLQKTGSVRPQAEAINRVASGEQIAVLRPGFVPFLFYLRPTPVYVQSPEAVPPTVRYLLVREEDARPILNPLGAHSLAAPLFRVDDKRAHSGWVLLPLGGSAERGL